MKLLRRITAIILTALMLAVTSVSVSAANLAKGSYIMTYKQ